MGDRVVLGERAALVVAVMFLFSRAFIVGLNHDNVSQQTMLSAERNDTVGGNRAKRF